MVVWGLPQPPDPQAEDQRVFWTNILDHLTVLTELYPLTDLNLYPLKSALPVAAIACPQPYNRLKMWKIAQLQNRILAWPGLGLQDINNCIQF